MKQEHKNLLNIIKNIDGFLAHKEAIFLYELAKKTKINIVEIGSWKGKSTICLAKGSKKGGNVKIYAIDPHTGSKEHKKQLGQVWTYDEFIKNIKKHNVDSLIIPIVSTSKTAAKKFKKKADLIFIDGAHDYNCVKSDFELWFPKLTYGGIMAFHDTIDWPGPKKLVKEKLYLGKNFKKVKFINSITYGIKTKKNTLYDRIENYFYLILKNTYEYFHKNKIIKRIYNTFR